MSSPPIPSTTPSPMMGRFLFNLFDFILLVADVILSTSLLLPELVYSYAVSIGHLCAQFFCLVAPARLVDYVSPTLRQPKNRQRTKPRNNQSTGNAVIHTQRAFFVSSNGELFRTEELTIDPIITDAHARSRSHNPPSRQTMSVFPVNTKSTDQPKSNKINSSSRSNIPIPAPDQSTDPSNDSGTIIFFMITGNPGACHYYTTFLTHLARLSGHSLTVRCVSFVGHQSKNRASKSSDTQSRLYGLPDQIELWKAVITQTLTEHPHCRIVIGGHSIGAYIVLQLLPLIPADRLVQAFLMFPAIMQMGQTPDGQRLQPIFQSFRTPIAMLGSFLSRILPETFIRVLIRANIGSAGDSEAHVIYENEQVVETTINLMRYSVIQQMLYLAHTELELVKDVPKELIERFEQKITLLCAVRDSWNPPSHQHMLAAQFPRLRIRMLPPSVKHAFVIGSSRLVASAVWRELRELVDASKEMYSSDSSDDDLVVTKAVNERPLH